MRQYKYTALSRNGAEISGVVDAKDRYEAVELIKGNCPTVLSIKEVPVAKDFLPFGQRKIKNKSLALMCSQFAIILSAGLPLVKSTELIAEQITDVNLRKVLQEVAKDVAGGTAMATSFENNGPTLPPTFIESVRAGEESGKLDETFEMLSVYFDKQAKAQSKLGSALIYPCFVLGIAVFVIMIIMVYAIPVFSSTLTSLGTELPLVTKILIAVSNFFTNYIVWIIAGIAFVAIALKLYGTRESGKKFYAKMGLRIPAIGKMNETSNCAQFARTMSAMSTAGLTLVKSIGIAGRSMPNYVMGLEVQAAELGVESGRRLSECLQTSLYLPKLLIEMIAVGEETGSLEHTMSVIGNYYDSENEVATQRMLSLLEPIMIVFLAGFVLIVLLAVYLPMFSMYGSM